MVPISYTRVVKVSDKLFSEQRHAVAIVCYRVCENCKSVKKFAFPQGKGDYGLGLGAWDVWQSQN